MIEVEKRADEFGGGPGCVVASDSDYEWEVIWPTHMSGLYMEDTTEGRGVYLASEEEYKTFLCALRLVALRVGWDDGVELKDEPLAWWFYPVEWWHQLRAWLRRRP